MSPSSNWYQLSVNYHLPPHVQKFCARCCWVCLACTISRSGFVCVTRVMSLWGSVGTTAEVTSLNRRDMFQSHHLVSLSHFSPAQRGNGGAAGRLQDSGLGAVMGVDCPFFGLRPMFCLHLCFCFYSRAREEREKARCDCLMNGSPLRHVVSIKKRACHHKS